MVGVEFLVGGWYIYYQKFIIKEDSISDFRMPKGWGCFSTKKEKEKGIFIVT